jgi:hypothetical protein
VRSAIERGSEKERERVESERVYIVFSMFHVSN